ncbi:MAG TPA: DUF1269 domain-containing protein [Solirubrobacteraceae bacterium]|jgi:uncharacterized membrane protein
MADQPLFVFAGVYSSSEAAHADYEALREAHAAGLVGTYDAAVVLKDADGKVHVHKHEKPTQHGAWTGAAVGAVVGILFPPSIIGAGVVGAGAGGLIGHLWHGMSRSDIRELGEALDEGQAALIVVGRSRVQEQAEKLLTRAERILEKEVVADTEQFERELQKAEQAGEAYAPST